MATVSRLGIKAEEGKSLVRPLLAIADQPGTPADLRVAALAAVPGGPGPLTDDTFEAVRKELDTDRPVATRLLAAEALAKARLTAEQLSTLAAGMDRLGPLEVDRLLPAFEASGDETAGLRLVEALGRSAMLASLRVDTIRPRLAKYGPAVQGKAEELYAKLNADAARHRARVEELLTTLPEGDVRRGQAVFNGTEGGVPELPRGRIRRRAGRAGPVRHRQGPPAEGPDRGDRLPERELRAELRARGRRHQGRPVRLGGRPPRRPRWRSSSPPAPDREERVARDAIEEIRPGTVSVMPAGLDTQLSPQEFADLLAFLLSRK